MKRIATGLAVVSLLGALTGVLSTGSASAAVSCQPVTSVILVCTDTANGKYVVVYSDAVVVEAAVNHDYNHATGALVGDGFTQRVSGAAIYCNPADHRNHLAVEILSMTTDRALPKRCA